MSSLVAHVAVGAALYFRNGVQSRERLPQKSYLVPALLVLLAIVPDFDYFAIWLCRARYEQRITHSILFCLCVSAMAWLVTAKRQRTPGFMAVPLTFVLASCSHLVLDLLVGRSLPLLWPLTDAEISLPFAILPGAAHTGLASYYFWRNLLVECGILFPVLCAFIAARNKLLTRKYLPEAILTLSIWSGLLFFAHTLRS